MTTHAEAYFEIQKWNERAYDEAGPKLAHASVLKRFHGDIEGEGRSEVLLMYRNDGSAVFIAFERITGAIGTRRGSFVLQQTGTFEKGVATATWTVVQGSGTGDLAGLRGAGGTASPHEKQSTMTLDYDFGSVQIF